MLISPIISDEKDEKRRDQTPQTLHPQSRPPNKRKGRTSTAAISASKMSGNSGVTPMAITTANKATPQISKYTSNHPRNRVALFTKGEAVREKRKRNGCKKRQTTNVDTYLVTRPRPLSSKGQPANRAQDSS